MIMADIFISYSTKRRSEAAELAEKLTAMGYDIWWDTNLIPQGSYRDDIDRELDAATAVIAIWSPEAVKSKWVIAEAQHANDQGKLINTHTNDLDNASTIIPKPFNITHSVLLNEIDKIKTAFEKLKNNKSSIKKVKKYKIKIKFTSSDKKTYIEEVYIRIKKFFENEINKINAYDNVYSYLNEINDNNFECFIENKNDNSKNYIKLYYNLENLFNLGDLNYSLNNIFSNSSISGYVVIKYDEYEQYLELCPLHAYSDTKKVTVNELCDFLWETFIEPAGVSV